MRTRILIIAIVVSASVLVGCSALTVPPKLGPDVAASARTATAGPETIVLEYWRAVGRHDRKTIDALSTAHGRSELAAATRPWPDPAVKYDMSHLRVGSELPWDGGGRSDYLQAYAAVREYTVEFVQLSDSGTSDAGDQMRFVIVAQETTGAPWRVDGSGTGP